MTLHGRDIAALIAFAALTGTSSLALAWEHPGRMTGGGSIDCDGMRVTHGFELHCADSQGGIESPNNLEINWGGNQFHLTTLETSVCTDNPAISEGHPEAGFDTLTGSGVGRYDQEQGYSIQFTLTDAGEPGVGVDQAAFTITSPEGVTVLSCPLTYLTGGNHQAHRGTGRP